MLEPNFRSNDFGGEAFEQHIVICFLLPLLTSSVLLFCTFFVKTRCLSPGSPYFLKPGIWSARLLWAWHETVEKLQWNSCNVKKCFMFYVWNVFVSNILKCAARQVVIGLAGKKEKRRTPPNKLNHPIWQKCHPIQTRTDKKHQLISKAVNHLPFKLFFRHLSMQQRLPRRWQ